MQVSLPVQCHRGKMETASCLLCGVDLLQLVLGFQPDAPKARLYLKSR